jgi:glycerol-3-phosphate dehydrogenase
MENADCKSLTRDTRSLANRHFDLVVIGGGIFGACAAWDASLRGLSVALIEKGDFGGGASANSYKIAHGGMRYMQHLDIARVRQSCHEKSAMIRVAPHLVEPLPIAIPTYGYGRSGKPFLRVGTMAYDFLTSDRNRNISDPQRRTTRSQSMSKSEILSAFPGVSAKGLTGAVVMHDGQIYNPPRLVHAFVSSSASRGAVVANYVEAIGIRRLAHHDMLVKVVDKLSDEEFEIRARAVLNTAGPWSESLVNREQSDGSIPCGTFSRDLCFVIPGQLHPRLGLAVLGANSDPDAFLARPKRHLFLVPWRDSTLVGVWHRIYKRNPDDLQIEAAEQRSFVDEINQAYPDLKLDVSEVRMWNTGLVPFGEDQSSDSDLSYGKRSRFVDHSAEGGPQGLFTLIGVRFTMGRGDSALALKEISKFLGHNTRSPKTDRIPVTGGDFDSFSDLCDRVRRDLPQMLEEGVIHAIAKNYGSEYVRLLQIGSEDRNLLEPLPQSTVLGAQIVMAARDEMSMCLSDIVFRRTDLASAGNPGAEALALAASLAAKELGWTAERRNAELANVKNSLLCESADLELVA